MMRCFDLVARCTSMSLATSMGLSLHYMDENTIFMNGVIEEDIYIEKPQYFEVHERETHVFKLKKTLYGIKKEPRSWCRDSHYSVLRNI
jgi:hypothetical protein